MSDHSTPRLSHVSKYLSLHTLQGVEHGHETKTESRRSNMAGSMLYRLFVSLPLNAFRTTVINPMLLSTYIVTLPARLILVYLWSFCVTLFDVICSFEVCLCLTYYADLSLIACADNLHLSGKRHLYWHLDRPILASHFIWHYSSAPDHTSRRAAIKSQCLDGGVSKAQASAFGWP